MPHIDLAFIHKNPNQSHKQLNLAHCRNFQKHQPHPIQGDVAALISVTPI